MREIAKYPNTILRNRCHPVTIVGEEEKDLLAEMTKIMHLNQGVGLAAPQIGISKQLAVIDVGDKHLLKLINPVVLEAGGGKETMEEGCLSIPNVYVQVKRANKIKVKSLDENGRQIILEVKGLTARAILHEVDHLKGHLIIDYLNPIKRFLTLRKKGAGG